METNNEDDKNTKLIRLLESNPDFLPDDMEISKPNTTTTSYKRTYEGICQECEDTPAILKCEQCNDVFCDLCFKSQHRKGKRTKHTVQKLFEQKEEATKELPTVEKLTSQLERGKNESQGWLSFFMGMLSFKGHYDYRYQDSQFESIGAEKIGDYMLERCKYIPLRLTLKERKALRLVEAALNVSEYTDRIDHLRFKNSAQRLHSQLQEICAVLLGIGVAAEYNVGQELMESKNFKDFAEFFQGILENGRRHKIMNPEKMRTEYGKLIYILQDSVSEEAQELVGFNLVKPIKTVYSLLLSHDSQALLQDPNIIIATREITPDNKTRTEIQREIKQKEAAIEFLSRKYAKGGIDQEMIRQCLYSIGDNNSFLAFNRDPVDKMIEYLKMYFSAEKVEDGFTLAISGGHDGSRLTHSHERQYFYVLQSLTLWREVLHDMFKLWCLAEEDLLDPQNLYQLKDTGQGLQRVQQAGKIYKAISKILMATQQKVGTWVGSSVIHLGDHNVPNALMFIDKYTQVPRILGPVVKTIEQVEVLAKDPGIKEYIDSTFGSVEECRKEILGDFFRHAFDGSGADNFFDAGSCIDGRLTSAWNWCSKIDQKRFYPIFKLTGFVGFDGDFQK